MESRSAFLHLKPGLSASSLLTPQLAKVKSPAHIRLPRTRQDPSPSSVNQSMDTFSSLDITLGIPFRSRHSPVSSQPSKSPFLSSGHMKTRYISTTTLGFRKKRRKKVTSLVHNPLTNGLATRKLSQVPLGVLCPERKQVRPHLRSVSLNANLGIRTVRKTRTGKTPERAGKRALRAHWAPMIGIRSRSELESRLF